MKTHPLNVTYLVIGLVFLGISASWVLREVGLIDTGDMAWLGPVALIVAGGVGLVASVAKGVRKDRQGTSYDAGYQPHYDPPLHQDYTSDIDRKLHEAERTTVLPATDASTETTENDPQGENR